MLKNKNKILAILFLSLALFFFGINNILAGDPENEHLDPAQQQALEHANKQAEKAADAGITGYKSEPVNLTEMGINPGGFDSMESLGGRIMKFLNLTIFGVSLLGVMYGGFTMMTSAGKDDRINLGKDVLKYSIAGLVITLAAYLIVTLVQTILYGLGTGS